MKFLPKDELAEALDCGCDRCVSNLRRLISDFQVRYPRNFVNQYIIASAFGPAQRSDTLRAAPG